MAGRPRDVVGRRRVFDLVRSGLSTRNAALEAGVSLSAAGLWIAQVGGVIPRAAVFSPRFLDREERYEIARLVGAGHGPAVIARMVGRAPATISRELRRNAHPGTGRYEPERAHTMAHGRQRRPKASKLQRNEAFKLQRNEALFDRVQQGLDARDSPQQIAGRLRVDFPDDDRMRLSHESIYQAIYVRGGGQLRRELRAHLRTGRARRRPQATRQPRSSIPNPVSIHDRPEQITERLIPGHHEGDLIMGSQASNSAIGTIVERTTGFVTLLHLPDGHGAEQVADAVTHAATSQRLPPDWWKTLTWDRGREMTQHARITATTGIKVYFADPYSPWQRGSNENINGLLREFFPKGTDLAVHTPADLQTAADNLNNRPRKRHGYLTPNEVIATLIKQDIQKTVATIT